MQTIKAFRRDEKGYYCQPHPLYGEKFYYKEGKTYNVLKNKVKLCNYGFHASKNFNISETIRYYSVNFENTYYGIVDLNVIASDNEKSVGDKITILKFLPQDFNILSAYDKTGDWIYWAACYWKKVDYQIAFQRLLKVDATGKWIYWAGRDWKEFDYRRGLERLVQINKTGTFIHLAKEHWKKI